MSEKFKQIQKNMFVNCVETDINGYTKEELDFYKKYLEKNSRILNILYDKNEEVTAKNEKNPSNSAKFKQLNILKIDDEFKKDSFDECI